MPKNTYFIKENYKKTEEIREVENQIPSYEEFLENYKEQVNYDDLTYNDISSSKNYGPMWGNSQHGERWTSLRIPCPVSGCSNTSITSQTHACGGQVEVSNQARARCQRCGTVNHVSNWSFKCSNHETEYRQTTSNSIINSLMVSLSSGEMDENVVIELIRNLRSHHRG